MKDNVYIFTGQERELMKEKIIKFLGRDYMKSSNFSQIMPYLSNKLFSYSSFLIEDDESITGEDFKELKKKSRNNKIILLFDSIDKRKKLFKTGKQNIIEFNEADIGYLKDYLIKNYQLSEEVSEELIDIVGRDLGKLKNEGDKLMRLDSLDDLDLEDIVSPEIEDKIFILLEEIIKGEVSESLKYYRDLKDLGQDEIKIISLLYDKIKQVLLVSHYRDKNDYQIAKDMGLNPYQIKVARKLIGVKPIEKLYLDLKKTYEVDVNIKTGKEEINFSLEKLIINLKN